MEYFWSVVLNMISFLFFSSFVKKRKLPSTKLLKFGIVIIVLWILFRFINYVLKIYFVGFYTDFIFILLCIFCIDFIFFTKLSAEFAIVRYVRSIRVWYTKFNIVRVILFLLGFFVNPTHMIVYPIENIARADDYHLIGPYWGNKVFLNEFIDPHKSNLSGEKSIISIVKRVFIFRQVVFQRQYGFRSVYLGNNDHREDVIKIGKDTVLERTASFFLYRKDNDYYITYIGDGENYPWPLEGDLTLINLDNESYSTSKIKKDYVEIMTKKFKSINIDSLLAVFDSLNAFVYQPLGVKNHLLK